MHGFLSLPIALVLLPVVVLGTGCASRDWKAYRHGAARTAHQPQASALSDPARVPSLHQMWEFRPSSVGDPDAPGFSSSPIVYRGKVLVGHRNGRFYAVDAATGALAWRYPPPAQPPLTQQFSCNPSSPGIASSATIARVRVPWFWIFTRTVKVVIFGAPDPAVGLGSGRLWALDVDTGALVWKSDIVANLTGVTSYWVDPVQAVAELHENIGYSSPVVARGKVYVGVANHCDNPVQRGKVVAVDLDTGQVVPGFGFVASGPPRGGGVWSSPAARKGEVFVTTGNGCPTYNGCVAEPADNHALSFLKLDGTTGAIAWKLQPVPWAMDDDPDWAATPLVTRTSCGRLAVAPMKDGWTHAVRADTGSVLWSFPYVTGGLPFTYGSHGDTRYLRPAAAWKDVILAVTGGLPVTSDVYDGYDRLYALNACAPYTPTDIGRVRWIADVPGGGSPSVGQPTVTRGIVYVGNGQGKLFAFADPDVAPPAGTRCSMPLVANALCVPSGFELVPIPATLASVQLSGSIRTEPALARGRAYVTTDAGVLHALEP
jgi:outer membrane protein assembly factor BamB